MTSTQAVPLFIWTCGALLAIFSGHPEFAGLGLMIMAGALRIVWSMEDAA